MPAIILLISFVIVVAFKMLPFVVRFIVFVLEKILIVTPWIISAIYAVSSSFYALGRQFFTGENAKTFLEQKLPPRPIPRESFSLVVIELMILKHEEILALKNFNPNE